MITTHLIFFGFFVGASVTAPPASFDGAISVPPYALFHEFDPAATVTPPIVVTPEEVSGVRHGKRPVIRLSDLRPEARQSTADFIKAKLRLPETPSTDATKQTVFKAGKGKGQTEAERLAEQAMRAMEIEQADEIRLIRDNNDIIALLLMANG